MGEDQLATANARILHVRNTGGSSLDLSRLELTDADFEALLPKALDLALVTELDLSGNQLTAVPDTLGNLTSLTTLTLYDNQLTALPDTLGNLTSLTELDLDTNRLTALPDTLAHLTSLTTLNLDGNQLTALPDALGDLTSLTTLNLYDNQLTAVPDTLGNLTSLTRLHLDGNRLTALPDTLGKLTCLTTLDLSRNWLTAVPDTLGNLTSLTTLTLYGNRLTALPDTLGNLTSLTELDLYGNQLTALPDTLGNLTSLTRLSLSGNQLTALPDTLAHLTSLTELNLYDNQLTALPDTLANLTSLTTLHLSGNQLTALPDTLANLTSLTTLHLSGNQLTALPDTLANLTSLNCLYLSGNQLTALPDTLANLTSLICLYLSGNQLTALPYTLANLTSLTELDLSVNQLTVLPDTLGNLTSLTELDLSGNQLTALPDTLGNLTSLTTLNLYGNQLTALPDTLAHLTSLTTLHLSGNQLTALPDTLAHLTSLTTLHLSGNQLTALPDTLGNLTSLTTLYLDGNQLTVLPETLGNLTSLTTLHLFENQLTALPDTLAHLTSLTTLYLDGNPLPPELLAAASDGQQGLLLFLRELSSDGVDLAEAKLVLVGEGEVGKSSLLGALRGDPWEPDRSQTHGMQIKPLPLRCHDVSLTLNAWDFGGQKTYRPTHQIFFTAPAVYVVVWKPRPGPEQGNVEHWLSVIRHRASKDAKVLVVASHGGPDSRASAIDEASLRKRFGEMIVGFHNVDSQTPDERLEALRTAIADTAAALPHVRRRYPESWLRALQALRDIGQPTMGYEEYLTFAAGMGLSTSRARSLAVNAHSLGTWIFYSDEDALAELVVLQPEWLSVAIARVLDDESAVDARGLVSHRRLGQVWSRPDPNTGASYTSTHQRLFLRLMERFELTYRVPGVVHGEETSLVAQLVPADQPDLAMVWDGFRPDAVTAAEMCQAIEKGDDRDRVVVPEGLIYRLIVRLHHQRLATSQAPQGTHWQRGLLTESRYGARALLTVTDKGVEVKVRGPAAAAYLEQVVDAVRDCFEFWPGLTTRAMATCGQDCGLGSPGRGLFNVRKLLAAQERGVRDVGCLEDDCDTYLSVAELLGGGAPAPTPDRSEQILAAVRDVRAAVHGLKEEEKAALGRLDARLLGYIRSVDDDAVNGPRLFTLEPLDRSLRHPGWTTTRMRLTLFCEHSRQPVHVLDPGHPTAGVYEVEVPREWWVKAAPILKITAALLKPVIGIGLADLELTFTEAQWTAVEEQVAVARESVDAAIEAAGGLTAEDGSEGLGEGTAHDRGLVAAEGGVLRSLHGLLAAQDITYADLRKVRDTDGRLLWVHPRFVTIFQPPPPQIPGGSP